MTQAAAVKPNKRGAKSREVVLDAAERVMAEHGYAGATMALIVEAAEIPASSIYHYFGSKDGVLLAVMERGAERFFAAVPEPEEPLGTPREHLEALFGSVELALEANPDFLRLLIVMAAQPPGGTARETFTVVERVREEARRRLRTQYALTFDIRPDSAAARQLAAFTLAVIDGAFVAFQADPGQKLDSVLGHLPTAVIALQEEIR